MRVKPFYGNDKVFDNKTNLSVVSAFSKVTYIKHIAGQVPANKIVPLYFSTA